VYKTDISKRKKKVFFN